MADPAAMRQLFQRLGFTQPAARAAVDDQGMNALEEVRLLTDTEAENLCKVIRRPGGMVPNPLADNPRQPAQIPNNGAGVSLRAENNLKLAAYWLRYKEKTSRQVNHADVTLESVRSIRELKEWEDSHTDSDPPDKIINARDWTKTLEAVVEFLRGNLGTSKIPLSYVVRDQLAPTDDPENGWPTLQDEMIARAPIMRNDEEYNLTFANDNQKVWDLISKITREHECWTYVKQGQRLRDGRMAFMALKNHFLGPNNADNLANSAERKLTTTTYHGEKRKWNFEKYCRLHIEQHTILEGLVQHGYAGIDARSKVRYLIDGIKTKDLDPVKTQILANPTIRNDFDACVSLYKDYIEQTSNEPRHLNIAAVHSKDNKGIKNKKGYKKDRDNTGESKKPRFDKVEDRYYSSTEYGSLTTEQRRQLRRMRLNRNSKLSQRTIKTIFAALQQNDDSSNNDSNEDDIDNTNNPALTRQQKPHKKK